MERQLGFYRAGLAGSPPDFPVRYDELERRAREALSDTAYDYVAGSAGSEDTARENRRAFERWRIVPRMLRDVSERDLSTEIFGTRLESPVMLAPLGVQGILHPDAERASARAAASLGVPLVLSTVSSTPLEDIAPLMGDVPHWYQLYWPAEPALAESLIARAETAGFGAIVITLDAALLGWRPRDLEHAYLPFLYAEGLANYFSDPVFRASLERPPEEDPRAAVLRVAEVFAHPALGWNDLAFARERTELPILLKGILAPEDARRALDAGIDGLIVSNHGGRQVDGAISALDALPGIVDAADETPVLFDSGIRGGSDIFKALALGARACLVGRPYALALGLAGEEGVREVLLNLLAELDLTMALSGCRSVAEIGRSHLLERPAPPRASAGGSPPR
ncbi:MAG: alpha-hydroxy-acid oxidizing protein [Gemmatimonadota bacterium]|nr:alpha-hydroxy-acid oxidizing protein [Gemmatimonadota bacterium]